MTYFKLIHSIVLTKLLENTLNCYYFFMAPKYFQMQ